MKKIKSLDMVEIRGDSKSQNQPWPLSMNLNPRYGKGILSKQFSPREGILVFLQDFSIYGKGITEIIRDSTPQPQISFYTCLKGVMKITQNKEFSLNKRLSNISCGEWDYANSMIIKKGSPVRTLTISIDENSYKKITGETSFDLLEKLDLQKKILSEKTGPNPIKSIDFAINLCALQIMEAQNDENTSPLFMEAKILEFISLHLKQLSHLSGGLKKPQKKDSHGLKIAMACEILKNEMAEPPEARELAKRVGLNHNQLVKGFKDILGLRPFNYLKTIRLEKAYELLESGRFNVTETAFEVGYGSLSHFTRSFREEFKITPGEVPKKVKPS